MTLFERFAYIGEVPPDGEKELLWLSENAHETVELPLVSGEKVRENASSRIRNLSAPNHMNVKHRQIPVLSIFILAFVCCAVVSILIVLIGFPDIALEFIVIMTVCFAVAIAIYLCIRDASRKKPAASVPMKRKEFYINVDALTGQEFEVYIARRLQAIGFRNVILTPTSGDYGVDIVATDNRGQKCAIQCKRYSQNVGVKAVQEVYAGAGHYGCTRKIVITSAYFTPNAIKLARELGVELIDRKSL